MIGSARLVTYQAPVRVKRSGNIWIDGLTDGDRWRIEPRRQPGIGYTFVGNTKNQSGGILGGYPSLGWTRQERRLMLDGMRNIENVSGLRFVDRGDSFDDQVEIRFYIHDNKDAKGSFGFSYTPGSDSDEGLVVVNRSMYERADGTAKHSIARGSYHGITFLHELCHAVGLKHPHERGAYRQPRFPGLKRWSNEWRDKGIHNQNAHPFTQMSYVDKGARNGYVPQVVEDYGFLKTLGALDIAALQWIYGINSDYASGSNVYRLPTSNKRSTGWKAIWDTGGDDRIDGSRAKVPVTIDLRNATLDQSESAGGYISSVEGTFGGFTIAHDWNGKDLGEPAGLCIIEHATGGSANDRLIGNSASNRLRGRQGDDMLYGGESGDDILIGGGGRDQFWIEAQSGAFATVEDFHSGTDQLVFSVPRKALSFDAVDDDFFVHYEGQTIARLLGVSSISMKRDIRFDQDFEGL